MKIIKYGADWCGPCREMSKILKKSSYIVEEIDIDADENQELVDSKNIMTIPVLEFYDDENVLVHTHKGLITLEELNTLVDNLYNG